MDSQSTPQPGGFLQPTGLPSPAPSTASSTAAAALPHPRRAALRPGSSKEDLVRRYVEAELLNISRRYVKKFSEPDPADTVVGFTNFTEVAKELDAIVNVLWLSGTPSLQIPFLLKLASDFTQYVRSFPAAPKATFQLLGKLDRCFASLLCGQDIETQETLPGFENGLRGGMTTTDMVRCRSLVEQTRVLMVEILDNDRCDDDGDDIEDNEEDEDDDEGKDDKEDNNNNKLSIGGTGGGASAVDRGMLWDINENRLHLNAARTYENTIVQLGNRLGDGGLAST